MIGLANGVLTVFAEGKITNVEYAGVEHLDAGMNIWVKRNPEDPHGTYSYDGARLEAGSVSPTSSKTTVSVSRDALEHGTTNVIDGNLVITIPARKFIEFRGSVTVTDDPANDKVIIYIVGGTAGVDADFDDTSVDFSDTHTDFGG